MCACTSLSQVKKVLEMCFLQCDTQFLKLVAREQGVGGGGSHGWLNAGCCSIVALIKDDVLYVANAGDSRAVLGIQADPEVAAQVHAASAPVPASGGNCGSYRGLLPPRDCFCPPTMDVLLLVVDAAFCGGR